jgi:sugar lactone lactonase YvrE
MTPGTSNEMNHSSNQGIRVIADYGNLCGEGPLWDDRNQVLYWTDITGKKFFRYRWQNRQHEPIHEGFQVAGFCLQESGGFVVTNRRGIWLWSLGDEPVLLASEAEGKECVMNDCIADSEGRVYAGSCHYDPNGNSPPSFLFRINVDGSVSVADEGIQFSNGLAFSPDCRTLYFADTLARCIYAYDWRREDGALGNRRVFVRVPREQGLPDGLTVDAQGFVWCAHWFGGCLTRYDPDGKLERRIVTPASQTSSLAFGGPDLNEIFITSAGVSDVLSLAPPGYDPGKVFTGGPLYQLTTDIHGKREYRSRVKQTS